MIRVGITGGIGSGKTTVSGIFKDRGIPVFNSDLCAREAEKEAYILEGFQRIVGDEILINGEIDRSKFRRIIFNDKEKLKQVNALVTPYIKQKFEEFCLLHEKDSPIIMLESAILFETGSHKSFDYLITVTASENIRIRRVTVRDNVGVEEVLAKLANQLPESTKITESDFVIINDGLTLADSLDLLTKQVDTIKKAIKYDILVKASKELSSALNEYKTFQ